VLHVVDFCSPTASLSPLRDRAFTRFYRGRNEVDDTMTKWGWDDDDIPGQYRALNDLGVGVHLYWDEREHSSWFWATDDPDIPGNDIGQWVAPVRTERGDAAYQANYRSNQSYPGIFNDDQNGTLPGRQPDIGNGSHTNGAPWGTWSGYYDWDQSTLSDTTNLWSCTVFLTGLSSVSVDNYPGSSATCDVSVRKPQQFKPAPGTRLLWRMIRLSDSAVLQSGVTQVEADGLVVVTNLTVFKDPQRTRLEVMAPPALRITSASTFRVEGAAGLYCVLETSTSPVSGRWSSALTFAILPAGVVTGNLPGVAGEPQRFHRLLVQLTSPP